MKKLYLFISIIILSQHLKAQNREAILQLIKRTIPEKASFFDVEYKKKLSGNDFFEITTKKNKILLIGNNNVSIASALYYYLKNITHCSISWNGSNLKLPKILPKLAKKITCNTPYQYRYYLNYCTNNYTMTWWNWERWEKEIDWMALNGINMPLAIIGQNIIWHQLYRSMGFSEAQLKDYFTGPAYSSWFWMNNIDKWGGPLPYSWLKKMEILQRKILERERALDMMPILPAFTGHVPNSFKSIYPNANIKKVNWGPGYDDVSILDPNDSLFKIIGTKFLKLQKKIFGTNHFYSADTFNENIPPTNDSLYLNNLSTTVYQTMATVDSNAIWVMQGWLFVNAPEFWQPKQIKALLNGIKNNNMIILDLWSETRPIWNKTEAYYGKKWIWCMLHNFGGNIGMYGKMDTVAILPSKTLKNPLSKNLSGIGLTPEGIEQNPVMYALMLENIWRDEPIELNNWLKNYATNRYGKTNNQIDSAWQILRKTVYNGGDTEGAPESIITGRPTLKKDAIWTYTTLHYDPKKLLPVWKIFIENIAQLKNSDGFRYDLVDITRQVLANYADTLQQQIAISFKEKNLEHFNHLTVKYLNLLDDLDNLLQTRTDFLLGSWINNAKKMGNTKNEKLIFERNARNLITTWGDKNSGTHDYANKQWAGLIKDFYKQRWQQYFQFLKENWDNYDESLKQNEFEEKIKDWEWKWVLQNNNYNNSTVGSSIKIATNLFEKYYPLLLQQY
ncbi:alpha-N-acetylglucosaminidase [Hydrotalea sp.]|uniref:alpha-N-acetylglucosaminidase n=1 Tax=Hydrotalea sp. TaxID=2881279 RepID=UPI003D142C9D